MKVEFSKIEKQKLMVEKVFLYLYEMAYHYRKRNHSMKSQTIVMCCKNTKFVENCVCDIN